MGNRARSVAASAFDASRSPAWTRKSTMKFDEPALKGRRTGDLPEASCLCRAHIFRAGASLQVRRSALTTADTQSGRTRGTEMNIRARLVAATRHVALACAALLVSVTCAVASPITVGTFEVQNDALDPFFTGPTFVVTNDSTFSGIDAIFADIHLLFDLDDLSTQDFLLTPALGPGEAIDSNGLTVDPAQPALPDLGSVLGAYLQMTLLDSVTSAVLSGTFSLAPTNPPLCAGCTTRMTDFTNGSTLAILFEPGLPDGTPVPEPASLFLMGTGIAAVAVRKRWLSR
jgi:hypothetical protein